MFKNALLIILVSLFAVFSQALFKKSLKMTGELKIASFCDFGAIILKLIHNKFFIIGLILAASGAFLWLMTISKLDLTTAFPITSGLFYILLFLFSWIFLGETITLVKILGMVVIIFGIYLVAR